MMTRTVTRMNAFNFMTYLSISIATFCPICLILVLLYSLIATNYDENEHPLCVKCQSTSRAVGHNSSIHLLNSITATFVITSFFIMFNFRNKQIRTLIKHYGIVPVFQIKYSAMIGIVGLLSMLFTYYFDVKRHEAMHIKSTAMCLISLPLAQIMYGWLIFQIRDKQWNVERRLNSEHHLYYKFIHFYDAIFCISCSMVTVVSFLCYLSGFLIQQRFPDGIFYYGEWIAIITLSLHFAIYAVIILRDNQTIRGKAKYQYNVITLDEDEDRFVAI